jgi:uncharacterized protein with HEPN domain
MSERDYSLFLHDILESIEKIEKYTEDLTFKDFTNSQMIIDAVVRNFTIIGEASANIPLEIQNKYPRIPWKKMKAMRNIVVHEYFGVKLKTTWNTAKKSLPKFKKDITKVINQESSK